MEKTREELQTPGEEMGNRLEKPEKGGHGY